MSKASPEVLEFLRSAGSAGGRAGRGAAKARTTEQARAAARARWDNASRFNSATGKRIIPASNKT
jgi:hypothetical protein